MVATVGYQAGAESNNLVTSYLQESTWGVLPAGQFQAIRLMGESLSGTKQRNRPAELNTTGEVSSAITTQEQAGGSINFGLSYGTFDDLLSGALNNDWQAKQVIAGASGDITLTSGTNLLTSTTANKFANIAVGQWIRLLGFTNANNNVIARVVAKASNQSLTLSAPAAAFTTETPAGTAAQVRASVLTNGTVFKSFHVQQKFGAGLFLRYPGSFVSGVTISGGVGQFLQGSFTLLSQAENQATVDASTGAVLAAPGGRVHDPVGGFGGCYLAETPIQAVVDSFSVQVQATGAALEYGMGSASAQGVIMGLLQVTGSLKVYFKDFALYQRFKSEQQASLAFVTKDAAGNAYVITVLSAAIVNPKIEAGSQNTAVMAAFDIEGNPLTAGGTIQIDRLDAV